MPKRRLFEFGNATTKAVRLLWPRESHLEPDWEGPGAGTGSGILGGSWERGLEVFFFWGVLFGGFLFNHTCIVVQNIDYGGNTRIV